MTKTLKQLIEDPYTPVILANAAEDFLNWFNSHPVDAIAAAEQLNKAVQAEAMNVTARHR